MNNILLFRGRTSVSDFLILRALPARAVPPAKSQNPIRRPALVAVWHTNPFNGRLECLWTTEAGATIPGEDGSHGTSLRRVA